MKILIWIKTSLIITVWIIFISSCANMGVYYSFHLKNPGAITPTHLKYEDIDIYTRITPRTLFLKIVNNGIDEVKIDIQKSFVLYNEEKIEVVEVEGRNESNINSKEYATFITARKNLSALFPDLHNYFKLKGKYRYQDLGAELSFVLCINNENVKLDFELVEIITQSVSIYDF